MIRKARAVWHGTGKAGDGQLTSDSGVLAPWRRQLDQHPIDELAAKSIRQLVKIFGPY